MSFILVHHRELDMFGSWQGWDALDTVMAAEGLALTLQSAGKLREAYELLERWMSIWFMVSNIGSWKS